MVVLCSLRKSLQVAVLERDEAKDELDFIRKRASTLEDELHFLKSEFSSKNTDVIERYTIQVLLMLFPQITVTYLWV